MTDIKGIKQQIEFSSPLVLNLTNLLKIWGLDGVKQLSQISTHPLTVVSSSKTRLTSFSMELEESHSSEQYTTQATHTPPARIFVI